jgi:general secretion pathway protein D
VLFYRTSTALDWGYWAFTLKNKITTLRVCGAFLLTCTLPGCLTTDKLTDLPRSDGVADPIRNADLSARFPTSPDRKSANENQSSKPFLFPGFDVPFFSPRSNPPSDLRTASIATGAIATGEGVTINFENADIQTVAKSLLGDLLELNFLVDPRVQQGGLTLASVGSIPRKDVLPVLESALRMSNAAIVREGNLVKIVPAPEATGVGSINMGAGEPGFGVSIIPFRYTSAAAVARTAENFLSRPGAVRVDPARNMLLIQGTTSERRAAIDMVAAFDVEWLHNQSVGVYPLKSTSPETMIHELERVFETSEGGRGQGVIRFQPVSRMNAVMAVAGSSKLLERATQWIARLDRSDNTGTTVRIYHLKYGNAPKVVKILNEIFVGRSTSDVATNDTPAGQVAPGSGLSRVDSLGSGTFGGPNNTGTSSPLNGSGDPRSSASRGGPSISTAFEAFSSRKGAAADTSAIAPETITGSVPRGVFQNVRITADAADNAVVIYSNQEDYRIIERSLQEIDRAQLQVAIDATVAEVTLTNDLNYGIQHFFSSKDRGSTLFSSAAQSALQAAFLQRVLPGYNLLLGPEAQPKVILNALETLTDVKVLSAPSLVVMDNQPALLQVGDEVPISTGSATVLSSSNTVVNTITMRNTGVILKVLPHVRKNGAIQLEIEQEISNVVNPNEQTLTPTIAQRRIHSTVAVTSGQTILLGGLISEREDQRLTGLPFLREIKYLGDLIGTTSRNKLRTEIIVFVKPKLIRDGLDAQSVSEEFRDRLETLRPTPSTINRANVSSSSGNARPMR